MRHSGLLCLIALAGFTTTRAMAGVSYSYDTDSSSYTGLTGNTVAVNIYLQETLTDLSTSYITTGGGLTGVGAAVNVSGTTGGTAAQIGNNSFTASANFPANTDFVYNQGSGAAANNLEFTEAIADSMSPDYIFTTGGRVLLGTLEITVGAGTTTYSLTSLKDDTIDDSINGLGQFDGNTILKNNADLDAVGNSNFTGADAAPAFSFTVAPTAVPEPACLSLLGLGGFALLSRRRRIHG